MILKGELANYNMAAGHQLHVMLDPKTEQVYVHNKVMYICFISADLHPASVRKRRRMTQATITFQVDVSKAIHITTNPRYYLDDMLSGLTQQVYKIPSDFALIGIEHNMVANKEAKPAIITPTIVADLTNNRLTLVGEQYGFPSAYEEAWACLDDYMAVSILGGSVYDAVSSITGVDATTVRKVVYGMAESLTGTVLKFGQIGGVSGLDYVVPPLGTFLVRRCRDRKNQSKFSVTFEAGFGMAQSLATLERADNLSNERTSKTRMRFIDRVKRWTKEKEANGDKGTATQSDTSL